LDVGRLRSNWSILKRLEYRGYDSAGVATLEGIQLDRRRAKGKLKNLEAVLKTSPLEGHIGIGHTRWATHGKPTESNAHPHATDNVAVVHNGIIENFRELRTRLEAEGAKFSSETDTEVVAHLVNSYLAKGLSPADAVKATLPQLHGAFALAFIFKGEQNLMIGARKGSPLAVGYGDGEMYLGSDAIALGPFTDTISYLDDGDWVVLSRNEATVYDDKNAVVEREIVRHNTATSLVDKANYRHFMAKEIHEQPEVVGHTLAHYVDMATEKVAMPVKLPFDFKDIQRVSITACGTASYAGFVAKYWFERLARLPVELDVASEFRYREAPLRKGDLAIFISQSVKPPIRSPRCAMPSRKACTPSLSSTCRPRPSRARAKPRCRRWPVLKSAWLRPRHSPVSSRHLPRWRSRRAGHAVNCPKPMRQSLFMH
jgi:glucosamine--fructose-6-phosphate aminotransferase (isomerizing)